jgi:hypothetical protein
MLFLLRSQGIDDVTQTAKTLIDIFSLLELLTLNISLRNLLRSCKINKI